MPKARALYDNASETSDELTFLRDDILEVIEKDYDGMEGWWLCGLKGKTGIAPSNRLVIITISESATDYDTLKTKYDSLSGSRNMTLQCRKTEIEDYDVPASNRAAHTGSSKMSSLKVPHGKLKSVKNDLLPGDGKEFDDYCVPSQKDRRSSNSSDSSKNNSPLASGSKFETYFTSYSKSEKDLNVIVMQIMNMMKKWYENSSNDIRAQIVKTICVTFWKKIQAYIAESAKTIASIKSLVTADNFKSFQSIKQLSSDLENILDFLNKFNLLNIEEKAKLDYLQQLSAVTSSLKVHTKKLTNFFAIIEKDKLWMEVDDVSNVSQSRTAGSHPGKLVSNLLTQSPAHRDNFQDRTSGSYGDYDAPSVKPRIIPSKNSSNTCSKSNVFLQPGQSGTFDGSSETVDYDKPNGSYNDSVRFYSLDAPDYDVPKSSEILDYYPELRPTRNSGLMSPEHQDYDCPKPQIIFTSSQKFKSCEGFHSRTSLPSGGDDLLDYDTPCNNSSVVTLRSQGKAEFQKRSEVTLSDGNTLGSVKTSNKSFRKILSYEELDYDVPTNHSGSSKSSEGSLQNSIKVLSQTEKNLLKYYYPFISEELKYLANLINYFQKHIQMASGSENLQPMVLINDVKSLAACSHKVLFIVDSILKRLPAKIEINNQLNFSCSKICDCLKNITNLVKQMSQPSSFVPLQKHLLSSVPEFQLHVQSMNKMIYLWK